MKVNPLVYWELFVGMTGLTCAFLSMKGFIIINRIPEDKNVPLGLIILSLVLFIITFGCCIGLEYLESLY